MEPEMNATAEVKYLPAATSRADRRNHARRNHLVWRDLPRNVIRGRLQLQRNGSYIGCGTLAVSVPV